MSNTSRLQRWVALLSALSSVVVAQSLAAPLAPGSADDLTQLSLSDLANVEVTSVSKSAQPLQHAAASVFVISHDEILRSSATNLFEALRLAPNLLVTQMSAERSRLRISAELLGVATRVESSDRRSGRD